jgi:glutamyl-tRNA reductase
VIGAGAEPAARLLLVGTSHRRAAVELRERLSIGPHEAAEVALRLADRGEAVVLSTCNRTEVYIADADPGAARVRVMAEFGCRAGLSEAELGPALYVVRDEQVALHLFRVAAGLDSVVPGEPQILGQVRDAHELAEAAGAAGPLLNQLFQQALHTGKRVRTETEIAERPASVAAAAAQLAREVFGELTGRRILVIGAGKMGELAAASLVSGGVENVFIANRTLERAAALAARFGGRAVTFDRLGAELERADIVVSSTRCPRLIVSAEQLAAALVRRRSRPLLLIDIAVPRDLDPAIGELPGCSLYDVDDLGAVSECSADVRAEFSRAEAIAAEEARRFLAWRRSLVVVPAITSLRRRGEEIRAAELARANGKLGALSPTERRAVEVMTAQIVNKLLHAPTVRVKEAAERPDGALYAAALRHLFALEETT